MRRTPASEAVRRLARAGYTVEAEYGTSGAKGGGVIRFTHPTLDGGAIPVHAGRVLEEALKGLNV